MKEPGTLAGYAAYLAARTRQATAYLDLGRETMALSGIVTGADGEWLLLSGERGRNLCVTGALVRLDMEGPAGPRGENEDLWDPIPDRCGRKRRFPPGPQRAPGVSRDSKDTF